MIIDFQVIPHDAHRYETAGDWWWDKELKYEVLTGGTYFETISDDILHIRVSKLSDPRYELLVFHHELTEALLCREAGVTTRMVDEWDKDYELTRSMIPEAIRKSGGDPGEGWTGVNRCGCPMTATSEPGDDPHCPYGKYHAVAMKSEKLVAETLGVDWDTYDAEMESL